ncbi:hypothetical protein IN10_24175 [Salmonella enterica]|uniref:Uncharacterized protein n=1 Tax=Salmonella newport TaxID=108619 RepID=A0A0R9MVU9_SALNE|nr:hypothetical protein SEEN486_22440 [Salmonella enterica subsp. enterica serovar Newport str. CVM N18486]AJA98800.1 hypothetical protein SEEN543_001935 [Salmonella enterica subsp. enterica serovar Newport str. CVM N1543]AJB05162.1 hypothetical protein SEEN425_011720 [Salmonella enterica subsp. enterica serovar Newport str. CVM 22425]AJB09360.1 hypothetical protein SEEN462_0010670 [Salmonella enterica subsp. enterica serovar Newport str. CVM 22462]AJB12135.1 hypothetical protein SEEN513_001735
MVIALTSSSSASRVAVPALVMALSIAFIFDSSGNSQIKQNVYHNVNILNIELINFWFRIVL